MKLPKLEWSHVEVLLAVAEQGSLSAAARSLGLTQPTVGRQIGAIEESLGVELFTRLATGMVPTHAALELLDPARAMREAARKLELTAAGQSDSTAGTVRVTTSVFMAHHAMPGIFARLRREAPEIALELVASDTTENLLFREADIAVRMFRPRQLDVVTRFIGELELGLFGGKGYLDRVGRPGMGDDLLQYDFVGYDREEQIVHGFRNAGFDVDREFFTTRCDNQSVYWELVRAGCGLGFGQSGVARADPGLEEVPLDFSLPRLPIWLTMPEVLRHRPAIRRVWDVLEEELLAIMDRR